MSFAGVSTLNLTSAATHVSGVGVTSWKHIARDVASLLDRCVYDNGVGGAVILFGCQSSNPKTAIFTGLLKKLIF